jgi:hypothetical protein
MLNLGDRAAALSGLSGAVSIFRHGKLVAEIERSRPMRVRTM